MSYHEFCRNAYGRYIRKYGFYHLFQIICTELPFKNFRCSFHPARDHAADEPGAEDIARRGEVADRDQVVDAQQEDAIHTRPRVL